MQAVAAYALLPTFAGHGSPLGFEAAGGADFLDTGHSLFFRLSVMVTTQILGSEMVLRTWPPTVAFSVAVCALLAGTVTERAYFFTLRCFAFMWRQIPCVPLITARNTWKNAGK